MNTLYTYSVMPHLHLTFPQSRQKIFAVCDIGPGSASVAILSSHGNLPSRVLASGISRLTLEERTPQQAITLIGGQIREAAKAALTTYHAGGHASEISDVDVVVHAPWMQSSAVEAGVVYGNEEYIHDSLIGTLAKDAVANAHNIDRHNLLEASAMRVELNGYPTAMPAGKHAHQVRVVSLVGQCDQAVKNSAVSAVQESFPVAKISWCSGIRALMAVARESGVTGNQYVIADMGVDTTHIISVQDTGFEQRVIPEGIRTILMRVADSRTPEATLTALRMLSGDTCSTDECALLEKTLAEAEPDMIKQFADPIGQMAAVRRVANNLLLVTHPDLEPWLARFFSRIDFSQFTVTAAPFDVCTPASINLSTWVDGELPSESLSVAAALVNIEART